MQPTSSGKRGRQKLLKEMEEVKASVESILQLRAETQSEVEVGDSRMALWQEQYSVLSRRLEEKTAQGHY